MDDATINAELARLHDEETRQNRRLENLEDSVKQMSSIALSVQRLADSMERMLKEQEKQGQRLDAIEKKPGEAWNSMQRTVFNTIVGAVAGALAVGLAQMVLLNMH